MINVNLIFEKGFKNYISIDATIGNDNSNEKLIQKFCNTILHKLRFKTITKNVTKILTPEQFRKQEYDHIIKLMKNIQEQIDNKAEKISVEFDKRQNIIIKKKLNIILHNNSTINPELTHFLNETASIFFTGWYRKNQTVYNFDFNSTHDFNEYLKKLKSLDVTEFTTKKLIFGI